MTYVLTIDQGTSGTKAIVVDAAGQVVSIAEVALRPEYLPGGGVEQDPEALWNSVVDAGRRALDEAGVPSGPIYTAADICADEQYGARNMIQHFAVDIGENEPKTVGFPGIVPVIGGTSLPIRTVGPDLGEHTHEVLSTVLGLVWALMRVSGIGVLSHLSAGLINVIRGIPIIVLLFYLYFVLPEFGVAMTALQASILGLGIAYSAYQSENFRAGIEAIDKGQIEAAQTIGMGWWMTMRRVVLPQAVKIVLPPYGNIMIMMLKDSSQASTITVAELALQGKLIASSTFKNTSVFTLVALMYLTMSIPLILLVRHFEKKASRK